jgi:hypothetical protein
MLTIAPINNNYCYNRNVSFRAKSQEPDVEPQTPKEYSYADLYAQMQKLEVKDIVEQEVIPAEKGTEDIQNTASTKPAKLEILPLDKYGCTKLHYICLDGDLAKFQDFIKDHPNFDPNQKDKLCLSYIQYAIINKRGDYKAILNILAANQNIDLNITDKYGYNDLHQSCYYGPLEAVKVFVENHPDINLNQRNKYGWSYIDFAKIRGHYDIADYLTKYIQKTKVLL